MEIMVLFFSGAAQGKLFYSCLEEDFANVKGFAEYHSNVDVKQQRSLKLLLLREKEGESRCFGSCRSSLYGMH